jgi:hypothetical protein
MALSSRHCGLCDLRLQRCSVGQRCRWQIIYTEVNIKQYIEVNIFDVTKPRQISARLNGNQRGLDRVADVEHIEQAAAGMVMISTVMPRDQAAR